MNKKLLALIAVAALAVIIAGVSTLLWVGKGPEMTRALGDCKGMETIVAENGRTAGDLAYLKQEVAACKGEDPDKDTEPASDNGDNPSSSPSSASPASSSAASASVEPTTQSQEPQSRAWEYLANRAPIEKDGVNAYGPLTALSPGLAGRNMETLTREQAVQEEGFRRYLDPMLAAAHESDLRLADGSDVDTRTARYTSDHRAWDEANKRINDKLSHAKSVEIVELEAGVYDTNFSIPGDVPSVRRDGAFYRPEAFKVLKIVFEDGLTVQWRLYCGFQNFSREELKQYPGMPAPSPGMERGPNGTPVKPPTGGGPGTSTPPVTNPPTTTPPTTTPTTTNPPTTNPPTTTTNDTKVPSEGSNGGEGGGVGEGDPGELTTQTSVVPTYTPPAVPVPTAPPAGSTPEPTTTAPPPVEVDNGDDGSSGDSGGF